MDEGTGGLEEYTGASCSWYDLPCNLQSFGQWLLEVLLWFPRKAFELITDGLIGAINLLPPIPGTDIIIANAGLLTDVGYFLGMVSFAQGVGIMLAAHGLRFLIRRIPVIG